MLQFYFLSILLNLITGLVLIYADIFAADAGKNEKTSEKSSGKIKDLVSGTAFFSNKTFLLIVGILSAFTGVMKLLSVVRNDIPVIGDLLPSLAGLLGGFSVILAYYRMTSAEKISLPDIVEKVFVDGHKYVGIFCITAGLLHFIFPGVLFF